jgi:phosphoribosyl 1,2-cyclic phosphodiesterase
MAFKIENILGKKIGVATDVGKINNILKYDFRDLNLLVLESNYDFNMLMECSYPQNLKMRIKSNKGHLCNSESGKFIADIYHHYLEKVFLAHISNDSNCPNIAKKTVINELIQRGIDIDSNLIEAVPQGIHTELYEIK